MSRPGPADRAPEALTTEDRLRALLRANRALIGDLDLRDLLQTLVQTACDLVDARYGALGLLAPDGDGLSDFLHVRLDDATAARIGHLPEGRGLLGALVEDPRAIRLEHLGDDPRAVGFPPGHPPMESFLGVPVRVQGEVFGNLYLTQSRRGRFSAEDEAVLESLAATAGVAVQTARLFEEGRRRQQWLSASAEVTRQVLALGEQEALSRIAETVQLLADADLVTVLVPHEDAALTVTAVAGPLAATIAADSALPVGTTLGEQVLRSGSPTVVDDLAGPAGALSDTAPAHAVGPLMLLPMTGSRGVLGLLAVRRRRGRARFSRADCDTAMPFATHAALALELAEARRSQHQLLILEDRARIARDLHDHVIQQLFAAGMTVQGVAGTLGDETAAARLEHAVDTLEQTVRQIRTSIFQLRPPWAEDTGGLRSAVLRVVGESAAAWATDPHVTFHGPVDAVSDDRLTEDVVAVVREGLSNVARHARAREVWVHVEAAASSMEVTLRDDGAGLSAASHRSGLRNLGDRAQARGGRLQVQPGADGRGTTLVWSVPLG